MVPSKSSPKFEPSFKTSPPSPTLPRVTRPCVLHALPIAAESLAKKPRANGDPGAADEASSSGLDNDGGGALAADGDDEVEVVVSQSDSENKDPSSNSQQEEFFERKRGRPSKCFLRKKYKKHLSRK